MFDGGWALPDGSPCDICPGYLGALPQIREAADACWALRKGVLPVYYPDAPAVLLEAAKLLDQAYSQFEAKRLAESAGQPVPAKG